MNLRYLLLSLSIILTSGLVVFLRVVELESKSQGDLIVPEGKRSTVTFLLGSDKDGKRYFELAERHFMFDSLEKTDRVIKSLVTTQLKRQ
jgi:hypothetical protein